MELTQLNYFRVVARVGNMTQAAEELHLTQPALSRSIAALEADLHTPLFTRDRGKLALTRAGELFLETADKIFIEVENGLSRVNALSNGSYGIVRYGASCHGMISSGLLSFFRKTPDAHVFEEILPATYARDGAKQGLESFAVDFTITPHPIRSPIADTYRLYSDHFILVCRKDSPICQKGEATEADIGRLPLVVAGDRHQFDAVYEGPNFSYQVVFQGEDIVFALSLVRKGLGCMLMAQRDFDWLSEAGLAGLEDFAPLPILKNDRLPTFDIYLSRVKGRALSQAAGQLVAHLSDFYQ